MRSIHVIHYSKKRVSFWWEHIANIKEYEKTVPLISAITLHNFGKKNAYWEDTTRVMWVPQKIKHFITVWQPKKKIVYEIPDKSGGIVRETLLLHSKSHQTEIIGIIEADFTKGIIFSILEWVLTQRLRYMVKEMFKRIESMESI